MHDNEVLMREVAELDAQLRQAVEERDAALRDKAKLIAEIDGPESTTSISKRMAGSMEAQLEMVRTDREDMAKQHAADRDFLNGIFTELEAQLALARTEREELHTRAERERRGAAKRIKELEEAVASANEQKERLRDACDREKEVLAKQFEQRVAGLRLEKEQAKLDKALLRRLEADLGELKELSTSVLGPLATERRHAASHVGRKVVDMSEMEGAAYEYLSRSRG